MNYIELINRFWVVHEENCFTTCEIAIYFYLLKVNNACNWIQFFKRNNAKIMADLGIKDRRTLENARNRLKQAGLIDYQKKSTNPNVIYSLTSTLNAQVDVQVSVQADVQVDVQVDAQANDTKDKHKLKHKPNSNIPPISPQGEIGFPEEKPKRGRKPKIEFVPPSFEEVYRYFQSSGLPAWEIQAEKFYNHWDSQGWIKGNGAKITNWDSLANNWILTVKEKGKQNAGNTGSVVGVSNEPTYGEA